MWVTPMPPPQVALGGRLTWAILNGNYASAQVTSGWKSTPVSMLACLNRFFGPKIWLGGGGGNPSVHGSDRHYRHRLHGCPNEGYDCVYFKAAVR